MGRLGLCLSLQPELQAPSPFSSSLPRSAPAEPPALFGSTVLRASHQPQVHVPGHDGKRADPPETSTATVQAVTTLFSQNTVYTTIFNTVVATTRIVPNAVTVFTTLTVYTSSARETLKSSPTSTASCGGDRTSTLTTKTSLSLPSTEPPFANTRSTIPSSSPGPTTSCSGLRKPTSSPLPSSLPPVQASSTAKCAPPIAGATSSRPHVWSNPFDTRSLSSAASTATGTATPSSLAPFPATSGCHAAQIVSIALGIILGIIFLGLVSFMTHRCIVDRRLRLAARMLPILPSLAGVLPDDPRPVSDAPGLFSRPSRAQMSEVAGGVRQQKHELVQPGLLGAPPGHQIVGPAKEPPPAKTGRVGWSNCSDSALVGSGAVRVAIRPTGVPPNTTSGAGAAAASSILDPAAAIAPSSGFSTAGIGVHRESDGLDMQAQRAAQQGRQQRQRWWPMPPGWEYDDQNMYSFSLPSETTPRDSQSGDQFQRESGDGGDGQRVSSPRVLVAPLNTAIKGEVGRPRGGGIDRHGDDAANDWSMAGERGSEQSRDDGRDDTSGLAAPARRMNDALSGSGDGRGLSLVPPEIMRAAAGRRRRSGSGSRGGVKRGHGNRAQAMERGDAPYWNLS